MKPNAVMPRMSTRFRNTSPTVGLGSLSDKLELYSSSHKAIACRQSLNEMMSVTLDKAKNAKTINEMMFYWKDEMRCNTYCQLLCSRRLTSKVALLYPNYSVRDKCRIYGLLLCQGHDHVTSKWTENQKNLVVWCGGNFQIVRNYNMSNSYQFDCSSLGTVISSKESNSH